MAELGSADESLRAEHDALAKQLAARPSVDLLRRAAVLAFAGLISAGLAWAILWDRYGKTPTAFALRHTDLFRAGFLVTALATVVLGVLFALTARRWRRMASDEEVRFARLCELRQSLGIDP
jgi:hypothetical protein